MDAISKIGDILAIAGRLLTPDMCEECPCFRDPDPYPVRCDHPDTADDADVGGRSAPKGCGLRVRFVGVPTP